MCSKIIPLRGVIVLLVLSIFHPNLAQNVWTEKATMSTARSGLGAAIVNGKIYAIGGIQSISQAVATVEEYDPQTNSWTTKAPIPTARGRFGCTVVGDIIYVVGGAPTTATALTTVESYNPSTDSWSTRASLPVARSLLSVVTINDKIYAIGGTDQLGSNWEGKNNVYMYNPTSNSWVSKANKPTKVLGAAACVINNKIYVSGGLKSWPNLFGGIEVYDPSTNTWTPSASEMPQIKYGHASVNFDNRHYTFGGWGSSWFGPVYNEVMNYDPVLDIWIQKLHGPAGIAEAATAVLDDKIYLIGGTTTPRPFNPLQTVYEYDANSDLTGFVESISTDQTYLRPGIDSVGISSKVRYPAGVSLVADIETQNAVFIDSVSLLDDGNHNDGLAFDSVFANSWLTTPGEERMYNINLKLTISNGTTVSQEFRYPDVFTTIGPVNFDHITTLEPEIYPGDIVFFNIALTNSGSSATAENISADIYSKDPCILLTDQLSSDFNNIQAGQTQLSLSQYRMKINANCTNGESAKLYLNIYSGVSILWTDSFYVDILATAINDRDNIKPNVFKLWQNYPNPFNPVTTIRYKLIENADVRLHIINTSGQLIRTLIDKSQSAGNHAVTWDGKDNLGQLVASGIYMYELHTKKNVQTRKLVLMR